MVKDGPKIHIVGGGLAGVEAAWQVLKAGFSVVLHEMRPEKTTEAHVTSHLGELVCSNSLKSEALVSAPGQLKFEMEGLDSLVVKAAREAKVPAGKALAVDREVFSAKLEDLLFRYPQFEIKREEITEIPSREDLSSKNEYWIVATGPLTSAGLIPYLSTLCGDAQGLYFYDAISPIIASESIDFGHSFKADRYSKESSEDGDYLNMPLSREEYDRFIDAVIAAPKTPLRDFEKPVFFESCLPIEVMIERGRDTLRFGPMKPVGLVDPKTGREPYANIQLRLENNAETMYNIVGFQTKMTVTAQREVFRLIPGLENAVFLRFGSIHRNTFFDSPNVLNANLTFRRHPYVLLAGQITGVEGYMESAAIGLVAGRFAVDLIKNQQRFLPPTGTMIGALYRHVIQGSRLGASSFHPIFQPMNANGGLLPPEPKTRGVARAKRKELQYERARQAFQLWLSSL